MAQAAFNSGFRNQNNELMQEEAKVAFLKKRKKEKTSDDLNSVKHRNES